MMRLEELALAGKLGECMADWMALEAFHPSDNAEFQFHIHALMNILMARAAQREYPNEFPRRAVGTNRNMTRVT
jgi:hypothetical protein